MRHHRAYGRPIESLDIVVVDDAKPMQTILRSILIAAKVPRVRCFDSAEEALAAMLVDPPSLAVIDWRMKPTDGLTLVRTMRQASAGPLALVPVIMITAHPTRALIRLAIAAGIHSVVAKPFSPATLIGRILAILADDRQFEAEPASGRVRLEGAESLLAAQSGRWNSMRGFDPPGADEVLTLEPAAAVAAPAARAGEVPYRPNERRAAPAEPTPAERAAFAAVKRGVGRRATGQAGPEAP